MAAILLAMATVLRIVDGDTLHVQDDGRDVTIRVLGIDCPESKHNAKCKRDGKAACDAQVPKGKVATRRARELLPVGAPVKLEPGKRGFKVDVYGRTLAYVRMADGRDFGLTLIREGLCADYGWKYPHPRGAEYLKGGKP